MASTLLSTVGTGGIRLRLAASLGPLDDELIGDEKKPAMYFLGGPIFGAHAQLLEGTT